MIWGQTNKRCSPSWGYFEEAVNILGVTWKRWPLCRDFNKCWQDVFDGNSLIWFIEVNNWKVKFKKLLKSWVIRIYIQQKYFAVKHVSLSVTWRTRFVVFFFSVWLNFSVTSRTSPSICAIGPVLISRKWSSNLDHLVQNFFEAEWKHLVLNCRFSQIFPPFNIWQTHLSSFLLKSDSSFLLNLAVASNLIITEQ